jgi:hypothetical protein
MKKGLAPVIIVIILVGALFGLGVWSSKSTSSGDDDNQQTNQQQAPQPSKANPSSDSANKPVDNLSGDLVSTLLPMQTIGNPSKSKIKITVGYTFDAHTQEHPEGATAVVDTVRTWVSSHADTASFQLVCEDLPPDQLTGPNAAYANIPLGISINGKQPPGFNVNPGEGTYSKDTVLKALGG